MINVDQKKEPSYQMKPTDLKMLSLLKKRKAKKKKKNSYMTHKKNIGSKNSILNLDNSDNSYSENSYSDNSYSDNSYSENSDNESTDGSSLYSESVSESESDSDNDSHIDSDSHSDSENINTVLSKNSLQTECSQYSDSPIQNKDALMKAFR